MTENSEEMKEARLARVQLSDALAERLIVGFIEEFKPATAVEAAGGLTMLITKSARAIEKYYGTQVAVDILRTFSDRMKVENKNPEEK